MKQLRLPKGMLLYHGTDCEGVFAIPDGPCWFAFDRRTAKNWVGWSDLPPTGRERASVGFWRLKSPETFC
jgi:hypothetical protein